jgi:hypothetical protein|tara:strand:+ start:1875 stop:2126 length:252 start_codon:yes stop_codon:yes gene_type:complete
MKELKGTITKQELKQIQTEQEKVNLILTEIGYQESKKHSLLHELADANVVINKTKKDLEDKYGPITIDLSNGDWTTVEKEENV